jgi:aromatic ring-opening dioxygenase catalytic subunit (LigB family)
VIVALSARWDSDGPFRVDAGRNHRTLTDYSGFGVEVRYDCTGHPAVARALIDAGVKAGVRVAAARRGVDSGVSVPLHFLHPGHSAAIVPLSVARRPFSECRTWGAVIRRVLDERSEPIAFVAGGVLSHDQHSWQLRRDVPESREFDERALRAIQAGSWAQLLPADEQLVERAQPETGLRHLEIIRGLLGSDVPGTVRCYESGPGVGSALIEFELPARVAADRSGVSGRLEPGGS